VSRTTLISGRVVCLVVVGLLVTLSACSKMGSAGSGSAGTIARSPASTHVEPATKVYTDVEALGRDSDLIVRGRVIELVATDLDDGGLGPGHGGTPVAFYTIAVEDHAGTGEVPASVTLGYIDTAKVQAPDLDPLVIGQDYVFFLRKRTPETVSGVAEWAPFYVPTSEGFGVFTVGHDGTAVAHVPELVKLRPGGAAATRVNDRLAVPARDLLAVK
jgi:hypothetical protein